MKVTPLMEVETAYRNTDIYGGRNILWKQRQAMELETIYKSEIIDENRCSLLEPSLWKPRQSVHMNWHQ